MSTSRNQETRLAAANHAQLLQIYFPLALVLFRGNANITQNDIKISCPFLEQFSKHSEITNFSSLIAEFQQKLGNEHFLGALTPFQSRDQETEGIEYLLLIPQAKKKVFWMLVNATLHSEDYLIDMELCHKRLASHLSKNDQVLKDQLTLLGATGSEVALHWYQDLTAVESVLNQQQSCEWKIDEDDSSSSKAIHLPLITSFGKIIGELVINRQLPIGKKASITSIWIDLLNYIHFKLLEQITLELKKIKELQRKVSEFETYKELLIKTISSLDIEEVLLRILTTLENNVRIDISGFAFKQGNNMKIHISPRKNLKESAIKEFKKKLLIVHDIFDTKISKPPKLRKEKGKRLKNWITLPIIHEKTLVAVIGVASTQERSLTTKEVAFLARFSQIALDAARSFKTREDATGTLFKQAFESLNDSMYILDSDGSILHANQKGLQLLQHLCTCEEPFGIQKLEKSIIDGCTFHEITTQILRDPMIKSRPIERTVLDSDYRILVFTAQPFKGFLSGDYILLVREEDKPLELERAARQERLAGMGMLAAGLAHEINNPLTVILGYLELLKISENLSSEERSYLQMMEEQTRRIQTLLKSFLSLTPRRSRKDQICNLREILQDLNNSLGILFSKQHGIDLVIPPLRADKEYWIKATRNEITQVLMNIIDNAKDAIVQARKSGGRIELTASITNPSFITITITDNGRGIPEEIINRIFDPFFTTKARGQGTGLGLTIVQSIMNEIGGHIHVKTRMGQGTTFYLFFPSVKEQNKKTRNKNDENKKLNSPARSSPSTA